MNIVRRHRSQGFTLVEVMIMVVIIGLLSMIAIPAVLKFRASQEDKRVMSNLRQLSAAAGEHFLLHGGDRVAFSELVGEGKALVRIEIINQETYPEFFYKNDAQVEAKNVGGERTVVFKR